MRLDFPTFDLPMKAYSGLLSFGHRETVGEEMVNSDFFIIIFLQMSGLILNFVTFDAWKSDVDDSFVRAK